LTIKPPGAAFAFGGHEFAIVGKTALYWPARNALIVADLHLEKASWFAARGQMLPPYDSHATLSRIAALVSETGSQELWCLGDNFHDSDGVERMGDAARALLADLTAALDWRWIIGNHDPALPDSVGGRVLAEAQCDGLILRHQAEAGEARAELSGHYHPKLRVAARGRGVSRPCFALSNTRLILPSFGALTGGLDVGHPEVRAALADPAEALIESGGKLLRFPV
jgi:uncharacterized protein